MYEYTNAGSTLIAYLVEVISGDTFEDFSQENIFLPLGMTETSWFLSSLDIDSIAVPYLWSGSSYTALEHYSSPVYPCGFVRTSILQQATFMTMLMGGGAIGETRILENNTLQTMMTHHYPELASHYGLFFQHIGMLWGHGGSGPGCNTRTYFYPEVDEGVIVMMNLEDSSALNSIHNHILDGMRAAYGWT
jgi:CubicO group peptidase (beta-lactamase class C family)